MAMKKITEALLSMMLSFIYFKMCLCNGDPTFGCREGEKKVLLDFKDGITDPLELLSSWTGEDCCVWYGIQCDNQTRHVVKLDLRNTGSNEVLQSEQALGGEIRFSLIGLKHLRYLDLSMNNFLGIRIPTFFGSLGSLRYLNLSNAGFLGPVPHQLGNLSHLHYLDLSGPWSSVTVFLVGSHWLANLSSLEYLSLNNLNLSRAPNLLKTLNTLPILSELHLSDCDLHVPTSLSYVNFTHLHMLDLSSNNVSSVVPLWLFNLTNLEYLDLSHNSFQGLVPSDVGRLTSLKVLNLANNGALEGLPATLGKLCMLEKLDLSWNNFNGELIGLEKTFSGCIQKSLKVLQWTNSELTSHLPSWFGNIQSLQRLDLSSNSLYGSLPRFQLPSLQELYISANKLNETIPSNLGDLFPELVVFDLSENNLHGVLTEAHFSNLSKLEYLYMSSNSFKLVVSSTWIPPLRLKEVHMSDLELGPRFPAWIRKLQNITSIDMSNAEIADILPNWFWNFSPNISHINLSHNNLSGQIPSSFKLLKLGFLDLSYNHLDGTLPEIVNNSVSGATMKNLFELYLSRNQITGSIPNSICRLMHLRVLDLSYNKITGVMPDCWNHSHANLEVMDFSYNNLHGGIPASTCAGNIPLMYLYLNNNNLSGEIPSSLEGCQWLSTLDLSHNKMNGSMPTWFAANLSSLQFLLLRANLFTGGIPPELGSLDSLQVIDLAQNRLSGVIPHSFGNFNAMKTASDLSSATIESYTDHIKANIKGREYKYDTILLLLNYIDLSDNDLSGEIPGGIITLSCLLSLNLSKNRLSGTIPREIGDMKKLESLDLSMNNVSGVIPQSMVELSFLSHLNLSYNHFSGQIPTSGQFQTFQDPSVYFGNSDLCGLPLNVTCQTFESFQPPKSQGGFLDDDDEDDESAGLYTGIALGFIFGLGVIGNVLFFSRKWRFAYFRYVDDSYSSFYVFVAVNLGKIRRESF